MNIVIGFVIILGLLLLGLIVVLAVQFVRLSHELHKASESTGSMFVKLRRSTRNMQALLPIVLLVRARLADVYKKIRSNHRKGSA
jgi:hypothetical protein